MEPEVKIIKKFSQRLIIATSDCVQDVSNQCWAEGLITDEIYDTIRLLSGTISGKEKARILILAVQMTTKTNSNCFNDLLRILDENLPPQVRINCLEKWKRTSRILKLASTGKTSMVTVGIQSENSQFNLYGASGNGWNGKRKRKAETENWNGKRKRKSWNSEMVITNCCTKTYLLRMLNLFGLKINTKILCYGLQSLGKKPQPSLGLGTRGVKKWHTSSLIKYYDQILCTS